VQLIKQGKFGHMVCLQPPDITSVPIEEAISKMKTVPVTSDIISAGRALGVSFGD
jgi:6-phosphofructokinase 1